MRKTTKLFVFAFLFSVSLFFLGLFCRGLRSLTLGSDFFVRRIICLHCPAGNFNFIFIGAGFDYKSILLNSNNLAHYAADGGYLVADLCAFAYFLILFALLVLRPDYKKIHSDYHQNKKSNSLNSAA